MQQKTIFWVIATLLAITPAFPRPSSAQTAADRIRAALTRQPVYNLVDSERRMSERQFYQLNHIAEGNSSKAMHKRFGLPHGTNGTNEEYYPVVTTDQTFWVAAQYRGHLYTGYRFVRPQYSLRPIATPQTTQTEYSGGSGSSDARPWRYTPKYSQRTATQRRWARGY